MVMREAITSICDTKPGMESIVRRIGLSAASEQQSFVTLGQGTEPERLGMSSPCCAGGATPLRLLSLIRKQANHVIRQQSRLGRDVLFPIPIGASVDNVRYD